ncbi:HAD family hydrolase [Thermosediminibacter oceani]|uniref:Haloacid dehalogenase domain protein hydrolase n=1 Tax=Thermosediminibacter oceani (strain ATCC BAA-1034 / DSM 16646 / JW/IW-1228P) TaxID=555079 RepID=D9S2J6_THEOJ|nr:HAD family hydrolase [Thermosediminibacter oceani]ADL07623.1 Haloacid dehalogenase domain protein hydrolase [Thermosediminibacter oceani DSM 16646]
MKTLLFDLDGTLLPLDTDEFIENYMKMLSHEINDLIPAEIFVKKLLDSTYAMINNLDPSKTNMEVFWEHFFEGLDCDKTAVMSRIDEFYIRKFPDLRRVVKENPLPYRILKEAESLGYELVIATNPIFPEIAIRERLRWINAENFPYRLITTYENMHFAKPYMEYYEEILSIIGAEPEECVMVGNDVDEDLIAGKLGIKTFLVTDHMINRNNRKPDPDYSGTLEDLLSFVKSLGGVLR